MKRRLNSTQRNYIIIGLCAILVIMGVGYAAFQSQLKISGTSNIASNFLVKITDIQVSNIVRGAADKEDVTTHTDTTATFGTTLQSPGDSITYDITIENKGTIDAVLKTITKTDTSNSAIIFETSGVNEGDPLNVGEIATMQVTVTYNPDVTSQPDDLDSTLKVDLDYEQAGGSVVPGPGGETTTVGGQDVPVVDSGDGLYEDSYEDGKYTYKGANPNNYITFNNETWRIISVDSSGLIKIMRNESTGNRAFDSGNSNNWEPSDIKSYLNDTYLPTITTNQDKIVSHTWSIGGVTSSNTDLADQINDENGTQSQSVSIGLITASEYLRANNNTEQCGNMNINNTNRTTCFTTNWMYNIVPSDGYLWTISPDASSGFLVFSVGGYIRNAGRLSSGNANNSIDVSPVLYLGSDITLTGDGSEGNPYVIS